MPKWQKITAWPPRQSLVSVPSDSYLSFMESLAGGQADAGLRGPGGASIPKIQGFIAVFVSLVGALVLAGWYLDIELFRKPAPGMVSMKANTAFAFILSGLAAAIHSRGGSRASRRLASGLAGAVFLIGSLTWWEYISGADLGIDELLIRDAESFDLPGRMAPMTAICFCLVGISLLASVRGYWKLSQSVTLLLLLLSMLPLLGYAYDVRTLYQVKPYISMALHTAASFHLLALSLLFREPSRGIPAVFLSRSAGGMTARRLLPIILSIVFLLGLLSQEGAQRGWFELPFAIDLLSVLCIFFTSGVVLWHSRILHRIDTARSRSEEEVRRLNEVLEKRVVERTRQLQESLDHVKRLQGLLPVCAWCKKVRDDHNYWKSLEAYLSENADVKVTHSICPDCFHTVSVEAQPEVDIK